MRDEFEYLERLFYDTYEKIENEDEIHIVFLNKDISEKLAYEFDTIKKLYFDIAGQGKSREAVQSMFEFRARRLLNFKTKIESHLKFALEDLVILQIRDDDDNYDDYSNLLVAYQGIVGLLKFITVKLYVSLDDILDDESLILRYKQINETQVEIWRKELFKRFSLGNDYVLFDSVTFEAGEYADSPLNSLSDVQSEPKDEEIEKDDIGKNSMSFQDFVRVVKSHMRVEMYDSNRTYLFFQKNLKVLDGLLETTDNFVREEEVLNFLIETNITPAETFDYSVELLNIALSGKNEKERFEVLIAFKKRLFTLKDSPSYRHLHLSNIMTLVDNTLDKLIAFVDNKLVKYDRDLLDNTGSSNGFGKIKSNLTVSQMALFFRLLSDENILETNNITKLSKQIASSFSSKQKDDISYKSVKNNFDSPQNEAIEFWETKLVRLRQLLNKY
ncbi:hypothetical protein [Labilibaculum manganireducens]|uniref:hypothetical protein n=1 Tax=Labilibaculum manganireducens TaxID=1940525 RepID=UPI0029F4EF4A|nr:hypothetical protein [Labilibaculum manganireducens]